MEVKTYRARSLQEALELVRRELGPDAAVLQTRDVTSRLSRWIGGSRQIEVTASTNVNVPSRFAAPDAPSRRPNRIHPAELATPEAWFDRDPRDPADAEIDLSRLGPAPPRETRPDPGETRLGRRDEIAPPSDVEARGEDLPSVIDELCRQPVAKPRHDLSAALFELFTDLIDAEVSDELARELIERLPARIAHEDDGDLDLLRARLTRMVEEEITCSGPIRVVPGQHRLVALVGPTGVGKTTTIAKLAANFHLRDRCRVGLITVDTYRIAAVEQLRTYADIIDLPMEVVSTPREMRAAVARMSDLDLVLMDTAGRSPRDQLKLQELKTMLAEACADEVHLVLSSVASTASMTKTAEQFMQVGVTSLLLTKLDEATGLGGLLPLLRASRLPLSYLTHGQNVPDDIAAADRRKLARIALGMEAMR